MNLSGSHTTWFLPYPWKWFDPNGNEWHDIGAEEGHEGAYASGLPFLDHDGVATLGIALPNLLVDGVHTLGGWWQVGMPRLYKNFTVRQLDIGPLNVIDINAPLAFELFKSQSNFPDYTPWQSTFLGHVLPAGETEGIKV